MSGAALDGVCEGSFVVIPGGDEFLRDEALISGVTDRFYDRGVVEFLAFIKLVSPRNSSGVVVEEVLVMLLDRGDDVSLHDLHVVNVVKKAEAR